jgi:hypothetical protein
MRHSGWTLKTNRLCNPFEIFSVATKTIVYCMAQLMHQGIEQLHWIIDLGRNKNFIHAST